MSLLDGGTEVVIVYPEIVTLSPDRNKKTKASDEGVTGKARIQVLGQSGTSSRRQEQDNEGYESEKVYSIRFSKQLQRDLGESWPLGAQSVVKWRGKRWALFGDENVYNSSRRTRHITYTIKRY